MNMWEELFKELEGMRGKVGFYYKNLVTDETVGFHEDELFRAASIFKFPLFAAMVYEKEHNHVDFSEKIKILESEKIPGCGAVQHMTGDPSVDILTLGKLMITISDNTAANALARHFGIEKMKGVFEKLGMKKTRLNRCLYDFESENKGIMNVFTPKEMGELLEKIYKRTLISKEASEFIEDILLKQQINSKIPAKLPYAFKVAHKTGEEEKTTHDVGIVYAKEPFIVCFASNDTDVPTFESFMRDTSYKLFCKAEA
ncbi:serine hydrolase [Aminipila luticellarii]|uniref:Serine hydrolase n=1 Tax=Aminipila luticellarii TaxID=2507160 RepID=A0A410PU21_9FIRM|nr:serine hydrolase [Aminipila luticellarii]QAT42423.1 serine hydrolase [Aminipila luticellarii]